MTPAAAWEQADAAVAEAIRAKVGGERLVVGLSGAQGSGKSTMAPRLVQRLSAAGLRAQVLALDDFYLTEAERAELARTVHPLLLTRGVPGTHDIGLLRGAIDSLLAGREAAIPIFDKARDDRAGWRTLDSAADVILLEGWCVGARPEPSQRLLAPVNALERDEDASGAWRDWVNQHLASDYAALFARLDLRFFLRAPEFDVVLDWRAEQERGLPSGGMSGREVERFIHHYERITRWMLEDEPADLVFDLDPARRPVAQPRRPHA
ncbi:kinase [Tsuneonella deserti]|uniref:Kinase n=1 Tax=Tsuneonella deserti TaxID=2035528 RepID=A0ABQ1SAU5_9SPHN|nr:kinase [Tsuneonella deserti]